jgi:hypothetical protein
MPRLCSLCTDAVISGRVRRNMNMPIPMEFFAARVLHPAERFLIIHDDNTAGSRAKRFADKLAHATGAAEEPQLELWVHDRFGTVECAVAAWISAEKSDVVIVSLRAGTELSEAATTWLHSWIQYAGGERTRLVVMAESAPDDLDQNAALRSHFRQLSASHGVDFLWRCDTEDDAEEVSALPESCGVQPARLAPARGLFTAAAAFAA